MREILIKTGMAANSVGEQMSLPGGNGAAEARGKPALKRLAVVTPVFNDWSSFEQLAYAIDDALAGQDLDADIYAVNDGSIEPPPASLMAAHDFSHISRVEEIELHCNVGHQRAIAIGLSEIISRPQVDAVLVLDADGEDRPEDIPRLIEALRKAPGSIVVAHRARRSESIMFRIFYFLYKTMFRILTGHSISFGNFALLPIEAARRLVRLPQAWKHVAASYLYSRIPIVRIPTQRGTRYAGQSSMNLSRLVLHGIGAMSVFSDLLFCRLIIAASGLSILSLIGIAAIISLRLFTDWAIPGWATLTSGILALITVQMLLIMLLSAFLLLSNQSTAIILPEHERTNLIRSRRQLFAGTNAFENASHDG